MVIRNRQPENISEDTQEIQPFRNKVFPKEEVMR